MKILIEMSKEHYDGFLQYCEAGNPAYPLLKSGIVIDRQAEGTEEPKVEILCEGHQAEQLLATAESLQLAAVQDIRRALNSLHEL